MDVFLRNIKDAVLENIKHDYGQLIFDSKVSVGLDTTNVFSKGIGETKFTNVP
ncbi:hypothetical protein B0I21_101383 [Sphingobacterium paludis]|uniref:Uncharacterized protein n=1 Tax=Sphingobacterium paludis TaxID=1476465 RepID=A0A4R7DEB2_9SPHI|nr:hypothetical protein B0I21_101383 [Sphingobacterium paludis]